MIPGGAFLFSFDAELFALVGFEDIDGDMAKHSEVFSGAADASAALVFGEAYVE